MAAGTGAGTGCQEDQNGVQTQARGNGCTQSGCGGNGNRAGTLDNFQNCLAAQALASTAPIARAMLELPTKEATVGYPYFLIR